MFRTPSPGDSISVALRKLLQGDGGEVRLCRSLQQREQEVWTSKIKYLKNLAFCVWEDYSFHMQLSYHGRPVSFFTLVLAFPQLLSNLCGRWWQLLDCSFESPHSHLEARNRWGLCHFLFVDMAGDGFFSHSNHTYQLYLLQAALKALSLLTSLFNQALLWNLGR